MNEIKYDPIGIIHSPFKSVEGTPIQPTGAQGIEGTVEIFEEYVAGLQDLDGFSHIILIYHFHLAKGYSPGVKPFLDDETRGLFATRSPARPNPIGVSIVRLVETKGSTLYIEDIDIIDNTPLLDIKPYVPDFDWRAEARVGWLTGKSSDVHRKRADRRFTPEENI
ncbi:tRNA (N6-threonylcarbamoyladenosine(37)-N6)-methyltransferase TrmO [Chloroflexota bacterium]